MSEKAMDFKKEYKDLYLPKETPMLIAVPPIKFIMTDGFGDPNSTAFEQAVGLLYALSYTIKMGHKKGEQPQGFFEYVVPPLEGLWWVDGGDFSFTERENWAWTIMIRQPDFVTNEVFAWACSGVKKKKAGMDVHKARLETFNEGLCVQALHIGTYATEPETMEKINELVDKNGLKCTIGKGGKHHEVYLSDPRKCKPEQMKTVLRHPVEK